MPACGEMPTQVWGSGDGVGCQEQNLTQTATIENGALLAYVKVQKRIWSLGLGYSRGSNMMISIAQLCRLFLFMGCLFGQVSSSEGKSALGAPGLIVSSATGRILFLKIPAMILFPGPEPHLVTGPGSCGAV